MTIDRQAAHPNRRSIRLRNYDYTQSGAYFITICTQDRIHLFGEITGGEMSLNEFGEIVRNEWLRTPKLRPNVEMDAFVVMPNHFHGIIILHRRGTLQRAPTTENTPIERFGKPTSNSIPTIVRLFKSATTARINQVRQTPGIPVWQRNYYEHVVRNESELDNIRQYIVDNPLKWDCDRENPQFTSR